MNPIPTNDGPTVTRRSDLSPLYKTLRVPLHRFRSRIVSIKDDGTHGGSPRIHKHPHQIGKVAIKERRVEFSSNLQDGRASSGNSSSEDDVLGKPAAAREGGADVMWVYDFHAPAEPSRGRTKPGADRAHTVYYFAGGGFRQTAAREQWKFCAHLASQLASDKVRVVLVSYPLAPAKTSLPVLRRWLAHAIEEAEKEKGIVSLVGDSAGGNIALSLALWHVDHSALDSSAAAGSSSAGSSSGSSDSLAQASAGPTLRSVLAMSPPTDMRNRNPEIDRVDTKDPVLGRGAAEESARVWAEDSDPADPYLSPVLADLTRLKASGMSVNGVLGTLDVLAPDALAFVENCKERKVPGEWLIWDGQMHCFPISACYGLREGKEGRRWVVDRLSNISS